MECVPTDGREMPEKWINHRRTTSANQVEKLKRSHAVCATRKKNKSLVFMIFWVSFGA